MSWLIYILDSEQQQCDQTVSDVQTDYGYFFNSFVKLHAKKIWEPQHDHVISKSVLYIFCNMVCYKGTALYLAFNCYLLYTSLPCKKYLGSSGELEYNV